MLCDFGLGGGMSLVSGQAREARLVALTSGAQARSRPSGKHAGREDRAARGFGSESILSIV
jgi:hypothetical protein